MSNNLSYIFPNEKYYSNNSNSPSCSLPRHTHQCVNTYTDMHFQVNLQRRKFAYSFINKDKAHAN